MDQSDRSAALAALLLSYPALMFGLAAAQPQAPPADPAPPAAIADDPTRDA